MSDETQEQSKTDASMDKAEFLATARQRFEDCSADEKPIREQALLDLRFVVGDQWDAAVKAERTAKGRPALTFNRCHTFVQQVSNEARQNKPQIKFVADDSGDKDTADVMEGMARHIQYCSDAQIAYETAVEYSAGGSFGYFGFITDYRDDKGWDQELKVRAFFDPFAVYGVLIPSCFGMEPQFAFVVEEMPIAEYKRLFDTDDIDEVGWDQAAKLSQGWIGTETVRIAEYWYIEHEEKEIKRKNPTTGKEETRKVDKCKVKFCKINGLSVIPGTETDWPGYCIPIIPVLGKQIILDGKPNLFSVVRFQRDPQQLINFGKTRIAETLGTQPIQPWVVTAGQLQGHEKEWMEQNVTMRPWLTVNGVDINGQPAPLPQRQVAEAPIQSLTSMVAQEIDDMKATAGIYDASLGARSNVVSGLAKKQDTQQSNVTNMHFLDNLERAFKKGGLIIADVMPQVSDTQQMVNVLGEDEAPKIVKINAPHTDENGKPYHYKIGGDGAGKYHVIVTMGRAFSTKRQESFDMMSSVLQAQPELINVVGDVFFQNSDMAGSDVMAERFKRYIQIKMPGLIEDKGTDPEAKAQALQAQLQQAHQVMQFGQQHIQQLEKDRDAKVVEQQGKSQIAQMQETSRIEVVRMQEATKLAVAQINASKDANESFAQMELNKYQIGHDAAHDLGMQQQDHANKQQLATQAVQDQAALADQGQQHTLEQGDQSAQNQAALAQQAQQQPEANA